MAFDLRKGNPELCSNGFPGFLPTRLILFPPDLGVYSPIDRSPNLIKGIHADPIPPAGYGHENATLFHNHNGLEGHSPNQGIRHGSWRGNERYDVQPLSMT